MAGRMAAQPGKNGDLDAGQTNGNTPQLPSPLATPIDSISPWPVEDDGVSTNGLGTVAPQMNGHASLSPPDEQSVRTSREAERQQGTPKETPTPRKTRSRASTASGAKGPGGVRRLSATKMQELAAAPGSLPVATLPDVILPEHPLSASAAESDARASMAERLNSAQRASRDQRESLSRSDASNGQPLEPARPGIPAARTLSTPPTSRRQPLTNQPATQPPHIRRNSFNPSRRPAPLNLVGVGNVPGTAFRLPSPAARPAATTPDPNPGSPIPTAIPLPPMSIPTVLQLELAGQRPSPLYIHYAQGADLPYESSAVKFERLKNFLLLPSFLERTMNFGALACLDAWLWTFTILPMRFCIALGILLRWWGYVIGKETRWLVGFVWEGLGRMWQRGRRGRPISRSGAISSAGEESRSRSRARDVSDASSTSGIASGAAAGAAGAASASAAGATSATPTTGADGNLTSRRGENGRLNSNGSAHMPRPTPPLPSSAHTPEALSTTAGPSPCPPT